jgi:hypothetical protein
MSLTQTNKSLIQTNKSLALTNKSLCRANKSLKESLKSLRKWFIKRIGSLIDEQKGKNCAWLLTAIYAHSYPRLRSLCLFVTLALQNRGKETHMEKPAQRTGFTIIGD